MACKALYHLENVNDSSVEGHTLTNNDGVTFTSAKFSRGANFGTPNTTKYLSINDNLDIDGGAITINTWVKMLAEIDSEKDYAYFCRHLSSTHMINEFIRYDYNSGTRRICINRTKNNVFSDSIYKIVTLGTSDFHMLTLTYDGANLKGYYNAVLFDTLATSGDGNQDYGNYFYIGTDSSYKPEAIIDETSVYNTALDQTTITELYNKNIGGIMQW